MNTKPLFRYALKYATFCFVFFWTLLTVNAQCPTVTNSNPIILDASGYTFADLSADYVTEVGTNGIVWYTDPSGGTAISSTQLLVEGIYYVDDNSGACGSRTSINVTFQVPPSNQNLDGIFCSNDNPDLQMYIDEVVQFSLPSGGSVEIYNDYALTDLGSSTDLLSGFYTYYIIFVDEFGNKSQIEGGETIVVQSPSDPAPPTTQEFCVDTNPTVGDLNPGTASSNFNWYASIDVNGNPSGAALSSLNLLSNGTYYIQNNNGCVSNTIAVTVIIDTPQNSGTPESLTYCENNIPTADFNLFDVLTGIKDSNGTWSGDLATSNDDLGTVNISTLTVGIYVTTYTVQSTGICPDATSSVTITIEPAPESGTVNTPVEFCLEAIITGQTYNLFDLLTGEDQTGTWSDDDTSGALSGNTVTLNGLAPATYNFTYNVDAVGSCDDVDVTVQIIINPQPNSGTPTAAIFCENDLSGNSPLDLFGQLSGNDLGGIWNDDSSIGLLTGSDVDITGLAVGSYNFTYSVTNGFGCTNSSTVVVTIEPAPESGTANTPVEFCLEAITRGQTYNLFDLLTGEDQTGTWSDDDSSGALTGNTVTLDGLAPATYNFTYDVDEIGSCDDVDVTVQIIINDTPVPTALTAQEFCDTATVGDLVATGTTIQWYDAATGGNLLADGTALGDGQIYYATQTDATSGCESSVRTAVTATIYQSPNAGGPNSTAIVACNNSTIDLNSGLDGTQDLGGTWYEGTDNTGTIVANPTAYDVSGLAVNNYQFTYYVVASSPCLDDSETITVTIEEPLNAGTDNTLDVCSNNGTTDLFTLIGSADTGGTWSPAMASTTGVFDPLVDASGIYTYSLTNACGTFTSEVEVTVTQAPNAGSDNTALICVIDGITDLSTFLSADAQSGGSWTYNSTSVSEQFDPNVDDSGVYTYTVLATGPCSPDSVAEITVTVSDTSAPVVVDANPEFCFLDHPMVLDLNSTLTLTGTVNWYEDAALTIAVNPADNLVDGEDYYATQTNSDGCESSTSTTQIIAIINDIPTPTLVDVNKEYCINDNPVPTINDLTLNITERDTNNIVWYDAEIDGNIISSSTELSNLTSYYAVLVDATTGCESSVRLEVTPDITSCGKLVLPDGFSPNNDGVNDTFDYNNLDLLYPNFEIEIFNRYGNVVYKGNASSPRFDGKSNQSRSIGSGDLPVGVYYYIFKFNDNTNKPEQGRLYLSR